MKNSEALLVPGHSVNKRIRFIDHDGRIGLPWDTFVEVFRDQGFEFLDSADQESEYEFLISCRHSDAIIRECEMKGIDPNRRALIVLEPECVDPLPFLSQTKKKYGDFYAGSESWAARLGGQAFRYFNGALTLLNDASHPDLLEVESRANRFVMIQAHKFSIIRGEQYSLRREVAHEAWKKELTFDLYGQSWLMSNIEVLFSALRAIYIGLLYAIKSRQTSVVQLRGLRKVWLKIRGHYKGEPDDQIEVLKKYRYALVIENSLDFVSEKLFNAMAAGCRALYIGESLSTYGPSPNSVVIVKPEPKLIVEAMSRMLNERIIDEFDPVQIRHEARSLFSASDATRVQRILAEKILTQFNKHIAVS